MDEDIFEQKLEECLHLKMKIISTDDQIKTMLWLWAQQLRRQKFYRIVLIFLMLVGCLALLFGYLTQFDFWRSWAIFFISTLLIMDWGKYRKRTSKMIDESVLMINRYGQLYAEISSVL